MGKDCLPHMDSLAVFPEDRPNRRIHQNSKEPFSRADLVCLSHCRTLPHFAGRSGNQSVEGTPLCEGMWSLQRLRSLY
jgi:hypothetical protein